jgi:hypothetical protein
MSRPVLELAAGASDRGLLDRIFDGEVLGAIVRGVLTQAEAASLRAALDGGELGVERSPMKAFAGAELGRNLVVAEDLDAYFAEGARLRAALARHPTRWEERAIDVLTRLSALPVEPPRDAAGRLHAGCTVRVLEPGGTIAMHCELETRRFPTMRALDASLDLSSQLSFYVPLALPEAGGELHVYDLRHDEGPGAELGRRPRDAQTTIAWAEGHRFVVPRAGVGDLLVFDAGRHFHRVTPVEGARARWTIGGFLARARDRSRVHYWS